MGDAMKNPIASDLKSLLSVAKTRRTKVFVYGFVFAFVACTAFLAFSPSGNTASPWFNNFFFSSSLSISTSISPYRSQVSSFFYHFFANSSSPSREMGVPVEDPVKRGVGSSKDASLGIGSGGNGVSGKNQTEVGVGAQKGGVLEGKNQTGSGAPAKNKTRNGASSKESGGLAAKNQTGKGVGSERDGILTGKNQTGGGIGSERSIVPVKNQFKNGVSSENNGVLGKNQTTVGVGIKKGGVVEGKNQTDSGIGLKDTGVPSKGNGVPATTQKEARASSQQNGVLGKNQTEHKGVVEETRVSNLTTSLVKGNGSAAPASTGNSRKREDSIKALIGCDIFQGKWVKDDSYPLYPEGSCPHIDEPFDCYLNGRPDRAYQKLRWKPNGCDIPRLNATDMLERLRGKRLVFVGDSLNRNMWESLVCVLRNSVKDKKQVCEASGRHEFRTEGSYSFLFKDYNSTVEFFRSPFLVQEWEMPDGNGTKETLRLDIIERSSSKYKDAHVIVFNTGHWWTHEKTSKGRDYYQEGNRVYSELNVVEAFHKALNTWAKWVDANVNLKKTIVFFRGYSASHFSGGQWNSGGACDRETEPIKNEKYLSSYPPKMSVLESVIKGMKTPISYLNITRMTDYRKDAHPSIYRKQNLSEEERRVPERYQDCSHWCLPGVPDLWNELLYAQLIIKQFQMAQ